MVAVIVVPPAGPGIVEGVAIGNVVAEAVAENAQKIVAGVVPRIENLGIVTAHDLETNGADPEIVKTQKDQEIIEVAAKIG